MTASTAPRMKWQQVTVVGIARETARAKTFRCARREPSGHRAGQHYVVRLTAPDGYTASRSYSIASPPDGSNEFELTVELEVRGPIGGWFVWDGDSPALLVGGGSGIVPLMAMLRLARQTARSDLLHLVVSVRTPDDLYYAAEIAGPETTLVYTRATPAGFARLPARLTRNDIPRPITPGTRAYICGSSDVADAAGDVVMSVGVPAQEIRVERFGPSG